MTRHLHLFLETDGEYTISLYKIDDVIPSKRNYESNNIYFVNFKNEKTFSKP
jgi:hypothetical protein